MGEATDDFTKAPHTCPHWGKGGRYVIDPASGKRVPADQFNATVEQVSSGTGEAMTAVEGNTLAVTKTQKGK